MRSPLIVLAASLVAVASGCAPGPRYPSCSSASASACAEYPGTLCGAGRCLTAFCWTATRVECAEDEVCGFVDLCIPRGTLQLGEPCRPDYAECMAGSTCAAIPPTLDEHRCRAECTLSLLRDGRVIPDGRHDEECPAGEICALTDSALVVGACMPPCDASVATSCASMFNRYVCVAGECWSEGNVHTCGDGVACPYGDVCDRNESPGVCRTPLEYAALHPRMPRASSP